MTKVFGCARLLLAGLIVAIGIGLAAPAVSQQINPTADAVKEQQLLQQFGRIKGRGSIPDVKSYTIEQPQGRDWRAFHEVTLKWIGGIAILGMIGLLIAFYLVRGMVRIEAGRSGRTIERFNAFERFVHWMTAASFVVLGLTGLNITFGKELLLSALGPGAFSAWAQWAKYAHNYVSFAFTLGVILIFLMWIAWNLPTREDVEWVKEGGGIVGHKHPPAGRFNAGQKMIYWIVVLGGGAVAASGYFLMFPFYLTDIAGMQAAQMVHAVLALLFIAVMIAHVYIGTIGMEGAFEGMWDGTVDLNWAKEHHSRWLQQEDAKGGAVPPAQGRVQPAE